MPSLDDRNDRAMLRAEAAWLEPPCEPDPESAEARERARDRETEYQIDRHLEDRAFGKEKRWV